MTVNLIDQQRIESYLGSFVPSDPQVASLLTLALGKVLAKRPENAVEITQLPDNAPEWLRAKWPHGGPFHKFEPDHGLGETIRHIADWLKVAVQDEEVWLKNVDEKGRPRKLLKLGSLEQASGEADKAMLLRNEKLSTQLIPSDEGEETVMAMAENFRIVRMFTPSALDREGVAMGHCIGQGAYDSSLHDGSRQFFSLRDRSNQPHATIEVIRSTNTVVHCQGKGNKAPVGRYIPYLQTFLKKEGYRLQVPPNRSGLLEVDGKCLDIYNLPRNLRLSGDLDLSNLGVRHLPEGLTVGGNLNLKGNPITALPEGLEIGGNCDVSDTPITTLPKRSTFGGNLNLSGTPITQLPEGLHIRGSLNLSDSSITELPEGLYVSKSLVLRNTRITVWPDGLTLVGRGDLDLSGSPITTLPEGLFVRGDVILSKTALRSLPKDLKVLGTLDLTDTPIADLPEGLFVHGHLRLSNTGITTLPERLKVGGDLHLDNTAVRKIPDDAIIVGRVFGLRSKADQYRDRRDRDPGRVK